MLFSGLSAHKSLSHKLPQKYGAIICHEPKTAEILLVDSESTQGRMSIRNWGTESDKVVLDHTWANKCIKAETALLDDDYGGCLTHDDGLPIGDQDDDAESGPPPKNSKSVFSFNKGCFKRAYTMLLKKPTANAPPHTH